VQCDIVDKEINNIQRVAPAFIFALQEILTEVKPETTAGEGEPGD
jgi:hypothetical protein